MVAKRPPALAKIFIFTIVCGLVTGGALELHALIKNAYRTSSISQIKQYSAAVAIFKDQYKAMPGDIRNAGAILVGCPGEKGKSCNPFFDTAGDGVVGDPHFTQTWTSQVAKTHVPAQSAKDETILFWAHLLLDNLIGGCDLSGLKDGVTPEFGHTNPGFAVGGGWIVGYSDGSPVPSAPAKSGEQLKGTVLLLTADLTGKKSPTDDSAMPISLIRALQMDQKMDDGMPGSGYIQLYGLPDCFKPIASDESLFGKFHRWIFGGEEPVDGNAVHCGIVVHVGN